jgi:hypothetical protein
MQGKNYITFSEATIVASASTEAGLKASFGNNLFPDGN